MEKTDEAIASAITGLAAKLGTTAEHLWGVLVRQAPISGACDLFQYAVLALAVWLWAKWVRKVAARAAREYDDEIAWMPVAIVGIVLACLLGVAFFSVQNTVAAFFNPEYWALHQILDAV